MKPTFLQTLVLAWLMLLSVVVQAQGEAFVAVGGAIRSGSSKDLAQYFGSSVELGFNGDKQSYSATQAEFVMKDFFSKNPQASFDFNHYLNGPEGTKLGVGKYKSKNGVYDVYVKMKQDHGTLVVDAIDFTKGEE
ncbi:DUF4783 domain-containing protein [Hymenobacter sp. GOD-10R]|jgi:hypothetical protein|uniref:DUF4783 domain-containing protein n=1 Tax=Hymenobacter sp. GOD-10R TaxID=3093922 RepID=UPI002D78D033|nr:DUF4783 domain-containing protein [Hymenobacter sp. GOD-10R]WRQ28735.1 DUF4783 domain-containing protein [Hymenobacter sp. GOD-10R]